MSWSLVSKFDELVAFLKLVKNLWIFKRRDILCDLIPVGQ
jgi:hypothetical protein